jgi:hypothetical protein
MISFVNNLAVKISSITDAVFPGLEKKNAFLHILYRTFLHVVSAVVIALLCLQADEVVNFEFSRYFIGLFSLYILYKEIIFDPRFYGQKWYKGVVDICSWLIPFAIILF